METIIALLLAATQLLSVVGSTPKLSPEMRATAITVANQAITMAQDYAKTYTVPTIVPMLVPTLPVIEPIKQSVPITPVILGQDSPAIPPTAPKSFTSETPTETLKVEATPIVRLSVHQGGMIQNNDGTIFQSSITSVGDTTIKSITLSLWKSQNPVIGPVTVYLDTLDYSQSFSAVAVVSGEKVEVEIPLDVVLLNDTPKTLRITAPKSNVKVGDWLTTCIVRVDTSSKVEGVEKCYTISS